jgi:hypothetical protein
MPLSIVAIAVLAVLAADVVLNLHTCLNDVLSARDAAARLGDRSLEQMLSVTVERLQAAASLAGRVATSMGAVSLLASSGFLVLGSATRLVRVSLVAIVLVVLFRAFIWRTV